MRGRNHFDEDFKHNDFTDYIEVDPDAPVTVDADISIVPDMNQPKGFAEHISDIYNMSKINWIDKYSSVVFNLNIHKIEGPVPGYLDEDKTYYLTITKSPEVHDGKPFCYVYSNPGRTEADLLDVFEVTEVVNEDNFKLIKGVEYGI